MSTFADTIGTFALRRRPDGEIIRRAVGGDALAFSEVYRRYRQRVFGFCLARLMSIHAAEDATQEVFLRLLSADPDRIETPERWLFGVAKHVCIDIARRGIRETASDDSEMGEQATTTTAEDDAMSRHDAVAVFLALRRLRPRYRTALVMREVHGQPVPEIAEALGIKDGAAYTLLSRARDSFGRTYAEVQELDGECRRAVELLYRRTGSGIRETESDALERHLSLCESCRREERRAAEPNAIRALMPLIPIPLAKGPNFLANAWNTLGTNAPVLHSAAPAAEPGRAAAWQAAALLTTAALVAAVGPAVSPPARSADPARSVGAASAPSLGMPASPHRPSAADRTDVTRSTEPSATSTPKAQTRTAAEANAGGETGGGGGRAPSADLGSYGSPAPGGGGSAGSPAPAPSPAAGQDPLNGAPGGGAPGGGAPSDAGDPEPGTPSGSTEGSGAAGPRR